jgi:hypothetical protein
MRVSGIGLVTFHAETEVLALGAVKAEHSFRDRLHALIAAEPEIITIIEQLILRSVLSLGSNGLALSVLEVL